MFWNFFKNFARMFRIKAGAKIFTRFFILQGHDKLQQQLEQQKRQHKNFIKKYHSQLYLLHLLRNSHNHSGFKDFDKVNLENDNEYHSIHINDLEEDLSDLKTVYSQYDNQDRNLDFQILNASVVQDI